MSKMKRCSKCKRNKPLVAFVKDRTKPDGHKSHCAICHAKAQNDRETTRSEAADAEDEKLIARERERLNRLASDTEPLTLADFDPDNEYDVSVGNSKKGSDKKLSAQAGREKRQEFNKSMGDNVEAMKRAAATAHTRGGDVLSAMPSESGTYIGKLAEQERRFGNRRIARTISLAQAQEALALQHFKLIAEQFFSSKIKAVGFGTRKPSTPAKRSTVLLLSDLHLGAELDSLDEPMPFRAVEEARRLEFIVRQAIDYKTQYRKHTKLVLLINGDIIEGLLLHGPGGAPLAEQKAIVWMYFRQMIAEFSAAFPEVEIHWQSGNHGRDKVRHQGRATSRKWDSHEFEVGWALMMMCADLKNVTWSIPFRAVGIVDLHGQPLLLTHADTEVKLRHPDQHGANLAELHKINNNRTWGVEFVAAAFGHYHSARLIPGEPTIVWNGALVPPNGHARTSGYIGEVMGQWLWEAVEGFPVGDARLIKVGPEQDHDERLGTIIKPFRFNGVEI